MRRCCLNCRHYLHLSSSCAEPIRAPLMVPVPEVHVCDLFAEKPQLRPRQPTYIVNEFRGEVRLTVGDPSVGLHEHMMSVDHAKKLGRSLIDLAGRMENKPRFRVPAGYRRTEP